MADKKEKPIKKDALIKRLLKSSVPLGHKFRSDGVAYANGMNGPDDYTDLISVFQELSGYDSETEGIAPDPHTSTGSASATDAAVEEAEVEEAAASVAGASSASATPSAASAVTEFPDAETYIDDVLEADLDYNPSDVDIPCADARTAILNATRSIAEINFRRKMRVLAMASIYGASRGTIAKYTDALENLGKEIESGIVAGEHEYLQGKIAEAQVKANIVNPKLSARATVISSVISDRMRGRTTNAQLATGVSERNADLTTRVSEHNAQLATGVSERNAQLRTGISETNAKLITGVSERNAELTTRVSERNASLHTEASIANANNVAKITDSLNGFYASLYSSEKRVLQSGLGSLLGSIANQCGIPGISWIESRE